jgi:DNA-directed RNA polymerase specialized sigma24 family protein
MSEESEFADFLRRVRAGDDDAATELVRLYEPLLRREIRLKLHDPSLARMLGCSDICQSVLASFFVRAAAGQYDLTQPAHLLRLLMRMARNKVALAARHHHAQRRDRRRITGVETEVMDTAVAPPSRIIASRDLLDRVRERLSVDERRLADLRGLGHDWAAIAATVGGNPDALRFKLTRALDRIVEALGLGDDLP